MQTYVLICLIVFLAGFTQGLSGFGSILLSLPLLAIFLDIKTVIPLVALMAFCITVILFIQLRKHLDWKKIYPLFCGALPGIPLGVFFLKKLDKDLIQWILGIILIAYSLYSLFFRSSDKQMRKGWGYLFGFFSGCLGGALSAGGPPVIAYMSLQTWSKDTIKVTLQGFFLVSGAIVVFFQALSGLTTIVVLRYFLISLPLIFLGTYTGSIFYGKIREEHYKKVMLILLACLGGFMIYRAA
ncbi:MAG: sulfite exporter TauE/SafE family protein [Deltaproteobacteria bacterium]|nr:sulfite exporter TauE/SafE family protein [Deltaproteobacteria bacterium]